MDRELVTTESNESCFGLVNRLLLLGTASDSEDRHDTYDGRLQKCGISLGSEFIKKGRDFPASFEDMPLVRRMVEIDRPVVRLLNTLAIVPSAPTIKAGGGISSAREGQRLFAISRSPDLGSNTKSSEGGRYAILVVADGSYAVPSWIPEQEAQMILKQLNDFDPSKQPRAFVHLLQVGHERVLRPEPSGEDWIGYQIGITGAVVLAGFLMWASLRYRGDGV